VFISGDEVIGDEEAAAEAPSIQRDEHDRWQSLLRDPARIDKQRGVRLWSLLAGLCQSKTASYEQAKRSGCSLSKFGSGQHALTPTG
jgi:hypothetical protein